MRGREVKQYGRASIEKLTDGNRGTSSICWSTVCTRTDDRKAQLCVFFRL